MVRGVVLADPVRSDRGGASRVRGRFPLTVDAGAHMLLAMTLWEAREPRTVLISSGLATMGFALPAAIAASVARPGARVVCLTGDGGLSMCVAELETLARLRLTVTAVVLNDNLLSLIKIKRRGAAKAVRAPSATRIATMRRLPVGLASGPTGSTPVPGLERALREAASGHSPALIDVVIDPASYPHVIEAVRG